MIAFKEVFVIFACIVLAAASEAGVDSDDNYVVGGRTARPGQFPFIVSLRTLQNSHFCGGSILSDRWVASAAHCQGRAETVLVFTGAHSRTDGQRHRVARIIRHPRFHPSTLRYDFSLLEMKDRIQFSQRVRAIRWPTGPVVHDFRTVQLAGWGYHKWPRLDKAPYLQWKDTITIPHEHCKRLSLPQNRHMVYPNITVCTRNPDGRGACMGDSGGPLIEKDGTLIGVVAWGAGCARGFPDVYFKFWAGIPFIRSVTKGQIPNLPQGTR